MGMVEQIALHINAQNTMLGVNDCEIQICIETILCGAKRNPVKTHIHTLCAVIGSPKAKSLLKHVTQ